MSETREPLRRTFETAAASSPGLSRLGTRDLRTANRILARIIEALTDRA